MLHRGIFAATILALSAPLGVATSLAQSAGVPLRLSGSFGLTARGYQADGIDDRRPPTAVEASANTNFSLFGLSSGIRLTYSTDQSGLRQSVNRLAFQTDWGSGRVAAGDVSPDYSSFSVRGTTVRGGLLEWRPIGMFIGVAGGRLRRAVNVAAELDPRGSVFARWLGSARFGLGSAQASHFHLIGVYSRDAVSSLEDVGQLRPQSNVSITPDFAFVLPADRARIRGSATLSTVSLDSRESPLALINLGIPDDPDIRTTYAAEVEAGFNAGPFAIDASFERIMPGFESHGLTQIRSDEQSFRIAPRLTLGTGRFSLSAAVARATTNLLDDQITTSVREMLTLTSVVRAGSRLTLAANYVGLQNRVDPADASIDLVRQKQVGHNVVFAPVLLVGSTTGFLQTVSLNVGWQSFRDRSSDVVDGTREGFESTNRTLLLTHTARITPAFSTSLSGGVVRSDANASESTITTANAGLSWRVTPSWTASLSGGWASNEVESSSSTSSTQRLSASFGSSYSLTPADVLRLDIRGTRNDMGEDAVDFTEATATLGYTHRF